MLFFVSPHDVEIYSCPPELTTVRAVMVRAAMVYDYRMRQSSMGSRCARRWEYLAQSEMIQKENDGC